MRLLRWQPLLWLLGLLADNLRLELHAYPKDDDDTDL